MQLIRRILANYFVIDVHVCVYELTNNHSPAAIHRTYVLQLRYVNELAGME